MRGTSLQPTAKSGERCKLFRLVPEHAPRPQTHFGDFFAAKTPLLAANFGYHFSVRNCWKLILVTRECLIPIMLEAGANGQNDTFGYQDIFPLPLWSRCLLKGQKGPL